MPLPLPQPQPQPVPLPLSATILTRRKTRLWTAAIVLAVLVGCSTGPKPLTYLGNSDLEYYKGLATKVDYPSRPAADSPAAYASKEPRRVHFPREDEIWDLSLNEAIKIALKNNKIIRTRDQVLLPRNPLVLNPEQSPSIYDPALQETGVLFQQRGVEAALSDFDAQLSQSLTWTYNEQAENNAGLSGVPRVNGVPTLISDTVTSRTRLDKTFADSGTLSFINEWDYTQNNVIGNLFPSVYTGFARAEYRRPLLAGAGTDYTRIAGPISKNTIGVSNGVVISRITNDMAIADFEASVHQLVRDVQTSYWDLALAYYSWRAELMYWHYSIQTWRLIESKEKQGLSGGSSADESQARESVFDGEGRAQDALGNLYTVEGQFRRLLGLPINDGRVIRPCDEPAVAEFIPDWHIALAEGITRRPEIRREKWNIKSLELQLCAARKLVLPRLDFVAGYQVNAFGNKLISSQSQLAEPGSSAFASLAEAQQTGWDVGIEASIPIGLRNAHVQVRNYELRLARSRAALDAQELDVSHEIGEALQALSRTHAVAQAALNRREAAYDRVAAALARYEMQSASADLLLRAQQSRVQDEIAYFQSLVQYNQAITSFYYRTGTILEESNVSIAEDMWDPHAYSDALRKAWARSHGTPNPFLKTEPAEFVVPPGRPTGGVPAVEINGPPPRATSRAESTSSSASPAPQTAPQTTPPSPQPPRESVPAAPLPPPPAAWPRLPQAENGGGPSFGSIVPVTSQDSASPAAVVEPVMPRIVGNPVSRPETFLSPLPGVPSLVRPLGADDRPPVTGDASGAARPIRQNVLPPAERAPEAGAAPPMSWSLPQTNSAAPPVGSGTPAGTGNSSDDIRTSPGDQFDMPLNQLGR